MTAGTPAPQDAETVDEVEALVAAIVGHQRVPTFRTSASNPPAPGYRCNGCDYLHGATDGPNSPRVVRHQVEVALAALAEVRAREVEAARREAWDEFVQRIATHHAYNGADSPGQRFYDEGLNAWLISLPNPYRDLAATHAETEES